MPPEFGPSIGASSIGGPAPGVVADFPGPPLLMFPLLGIALGLNDGGADGEGLTGAVACGPVVEPLAG